MLRTLLFLPRLQRLTITPPVFTHLLGLRGNTAPTAEQCLHQQGILSVLPSIVELCRLDLNLDLDSSDSSIQPARAALASRKGLIKYLLLRDLNAGMVGLMMYVEAVEFELKGLLMGFYDRSFDAEARTFVTRFPGSLESVTLELNITGSLDEVLSGAQDEEGAGPGLHFSALRHLRHNGRSTIINSAIQLFSTSPITTLNLRVLDYNTAEQPESDPVARLLVAALKLWGASLVQSRADMSGNAFVRGTNAGKMIDEVTLAAPKVDFYVQPRYDLFCNRPDHAGSVGLHKTCAAAVESTSATISWIAYE